MPGTEFEFSRDEVDLAPLRLFERVLGRSKDGARVRHRRPEHHLVETVGNVIVMRNCLAVTQAAVQCAALLGLNGGRGNRPQRVEPDD